MHIDTRTPLEKYQAALAKVLNNLEKKYPEYSSELRKKIALKILQGR